MGNLLSIVIPCFNSGAFLKDALDSIDVYTGVNKLEVIIVDDGSDDKATQEYLRTVKGKFPIRIIYQKNAGPAAARNTGVQKAESDFILFLDSDNKIRANEFIDKGIKLLIERPDVGVFYGNAFFFGSGNNTRFESEPLDILKLLDHNYIDMCSMIRKQVWQEVGGLDESRLIIGHEDWDFWLRIYKTQWQFYYVPEILFEYRVRENSLITQAGQSERYFKAYEHILKKHSDLMAMNYPKLYARFSGLTIIHQANITNPWRGFVKSLLWKFGLKRAVKF